MAVRILQFSSEDGLLEKVRRKRTKSEVQRDEVKRILAAASKGQVELPPDERFIVEEWGQPTISELSDKLAAQGFSLVEQVRAGRPADLMKRNLRYMHYMDKKRKLDAEKARKIVMEHLRKKDTKEIVRKERNKITCELIQVPLYKSRKLSVIFDDEDFAAVGKKKKKVKKAAEYL
ncbi:unnamed protein product [Angiostrongylus costaricensis]|uniref:40S ribosomal protein S19-binding protein 1 n=1 Tax=Angiostrongylus costaricensis TaxID=334426 RepID=A0A0R3PQ38_ANGCS|nr:unnamed protein product [Angiostrongylus costaricensis]